MNKYDQVGGRRRSFQWHDEVPSTQERSCTQSLLTLLDEVIPIENKLDRSLPSEHADEQILQRPLAVHEEHPVGPLLLIGDQEMP